MKFISLTDIQEIGVSHNPEIKKQEILGKGELPGLTNFSIARFAPGQAADAHKHPDKYEVFFVESGEGSISIDGRKKFLKPGICAVAEPGEEHEIRNTGEADLVLIYFGIEG